MTDQPQVPTLFGRYYPKDYIAAVFDDRAALDHAVAELRACGCSDNDITIVSGAEVLEAQRQLEEQRNLAQRIAALLPSEEQEPLDQYLEEARAGSTFVVIYAPDVQIFQQARSILKQHGARRMRHYGEALITDL